MTVELALQQAGVRVRELDWEDRGITVDHQLKATTNFGVYYVERGRGGLYDWWAPATRGKIQVKTLEAAKAAAQTDYTTRSIASFELGEDEMVDPTVEQARELLATSTALVEAFHEAYERLALQFGYTTRQDTKQFDAESPNGKLMCAVCEALIAPILRGYIATAATKGDTK